MKHKEKSARLFQNNIHLFRCPICNSSMEVIQLKSLVCVNRHTFDFAKQGYVNLLTRPIRSNYDKALFQARQSIMMESKLFTPLHKKISEFIIENVNDLEDNFVIIDAGSGEGSHLKRIININEDVTITGIGLDISKEGIQLAARSDDRSMWVVADLANAPLVDQSCAFILNILSPANYKEFKRLLTPNGFVIKVVPRARYLHELRLALFQEQQKKSYTNEEIVSLFEAHFQLVDKLELTYSKNLSDDELKNLIKMTPLSWSIENNEMSHIDSRVIPEITVDFEILIGRNSFGYES